MLGSDIITSVRASTLLDTGQISDAQFITWMNEGYYRVATMQPWPWLEAVTSYTTSPGAPSVALTSLAADLRRVGAVYDIANQVRLRPADASTVLANTGPAVLSDIASTITEPITGAGDTSMTVASGALLLRLAGYTPTTGNPLYVRFTLDGEIVGVTNISTNVCTITRGQFGTTATTHLDNAAIKFAPMLDSGRPTLYFLWAEAMYFWPIPDDDYSILVTYQKTPTAITTSTSPEFDTQFHDLLAHYCEFRAWQREEDLEKANASYSHYADLVNRMGDWYRERVDEAPWRVGSGAVSPIRTNTSFLNG